MFVLVLPTCVVQDQALLSHKVRAQETRGESDVAWGRLGPREWFNINGTEHGIRIRHSSCLAWSVWGPRGTRGPGHVRAHRTSPSKWDILTRQVTWPDLHITESHWWLFWKYNCVRALRAIAHLIIYLQVDYFPQNENWALSSSCSEWQTRDSKSDMLISKLCS